MPEFFPDPSYVFGLGVMALLGIAMILIPLSKAGRPEDPAPPVAMM